jgi:hypothetical protein
MLYVQSRDDSFFIQAAVSMACMSIARDKVNKRREAGLCGRAERILANACVLPESSDMPFFLLPMLIAKDAEH